MMSEHAATLRETKTYALIGCCAPGSNYSSRVSVQPVGPAHIRVRSAGKNTGVLRKKYADLKPVSASEFFFIFYYYY